jgi:predicted GIY-YIG superfamily endonuclease
MPTPPPHSDPPAPAVWFVYVLQSLAPRYGKRGQRLPGFFYVGATTDPLRRLRQHNGEILGGGRYTSKHRPWELRAVYGTYSGQSEALKAERALKKGKRGAARLAWTPADSPWCRGEGVNHPLVLTLSSTTGQG